MSRHKFNFDLLTLLVLSSALAFGPTQSAPPPDGPLRSLFRPRDRFPVHFKSGGSDGGKKALEENISGRLSSLGLPPIKDVTPTESAKVKIFEIGAPEGSPTPPPSATPGSNRFRIPSSSTVKSLLDETEPLGSEGFPTEAEPSEDEESEVAEGAESEGGDEEVEPVGQATFYGGTPTTFVAAPPLVLRSPYSARVRPSLSPYGLTGSTSFRPGPGPTVTVPVATRPPVGPTVPVLGVGPSPPVTSVGPPAPPAGSSGFRSLFSTGTGGRARRPGGNRDPVTRGVASTRVVGTTVSTLDLNTDVITDFVFSDIKCYRTKQKEYFGAKIHLKSGFHVPYIRDRPDDPLTSAECTLEPTRDSNTFHMKMTDLRGCGVEQCGDSMCVTMVFPRVPTLALADDEVTTIKCLPQKSSMAEMKTISFAGDSLENRRSGSTVEGGGQDFAAEVGVFRQNPGNSNGLFVKRVNSGGVVQLGEPLQLRSVVRGGDGWTFSKLTEVKVWRMRDSYSATLASEPLNPRDASEVITLVDSRGCRNGEFRVIADSDPLRDPRNDLVHHFTFKAFLFRGQRANEPLIVTAKVQACQERDDCDFSDCDATTSGNDEGRYKRSLSDDPRQSNATSMNWSSQLALRVVGLKDLHYPSPSFSPDELDSNEPAPIQISYACAEKMGLSAFVGAFLTIFLATLIWTLISFCRRGKRIETKFKQGFVGQSEMRRTPMTPDYVRTPPANKPLPPIPTTEQQSVVHRSTNQNFPVAQLLQELAEEGSEYASVRKEAQDEDDDGVYVLYYKRSRSAPASLRERMRTGRSGTMTDVDDSEEDWQDRAHCPRQTVRSVKKRSQRSRKMRERKCIPFPTGASHPELRWNNQNLGGSRTSIRIGSAADEADFYAHHNPSTSTHSSTSTPSPSTSNFPATNFVSRNEGSKTQIIIIPETNV